MRGKSLNKRKDIQVLRGIAVLSVVLYHSIESFFSYGWLGVDVFFVISGYVLANQLLQIFQGKKTIKRGGASRKLIEFYKRRFWRLAPALLVVLLGSTLLFFFCAPPSSHANFSLQGLAALFLVANVGAVKFTGDYFQAAPNALIHTWSLSVEEQIYILLPLALILMLFFIKSNKKNFAFVILGLAIFSFIINIKPEVIYPLYGIIVSQENLESFSFYSPIERFWQFGIGILAKLAADNDLKNNLTIRLTYLTTVIFVIFCILTSDSPITSLEIFASMTAGVILYTKVLLRIPQRLAFSLVWTGDRSYSIYLLHLPLIYIAIYSPIISAHTHNNRVERIVAVIISLSLGSSLYSRVEQKFRENTDFSAKVFKSQKLKILVTYFLTTLIVFIMMLIGSGNKYFGLTNNPDKSIAEWDLTHECNSPSSGSELCIVQNEAGAKTAILIGDSHAAHIKMSFLESARLNNFNAIVSINVGCKFILDKNYNKDIADSCILRNEMIYKYIKENKTDYVFVSQKVLANSPLYMLKKAILDLKSYVSVIIVIPNTPEFPDNYRDRPIIAQMIGNIQNDFELNQMRQENESASDSLIEILGTEVQILDLTSIFCEEQSCSRFRNGKYLFIDESHLSVEGAKLTLPALARKMEELAD